MCAVRESIDAHHIEAQGVTAPRGVPLQEEPRGANDLALLARIHGGERAAEIGAEALPHLDHGQQIAIEAYQIELPGLAAYVARQHLETLRLQKLGREPFGCEAMLRTEIGRHPQEFCLGEGDPPRKFVLGSWQNAAMLMNQLDKRGGDS
jgi:hypothetical protein